jgi:hypothetical protein
VAIDGMSTLNRPLVVSLGLNNPPRTYFTLVKLLVKNIYPKHETGGIYVKLLRLYATFLLNYTLKCVRLIMAYRGFHTAYCQKKITVLRIAAVRSLHLRADCHVQTWPHLILTACERGLAIRSALENCL